MKTFVAHISVRPNFLVEVLDTTSGCPAASLPVHLYQQTAQKGHWEKVDEGPTCDDGQLMLLKRHALVSETQYKLRLNTSEYFSAKGDNSIYPCVEIRVQIPAEVKHLHVSVHIGRHGYAAYVGT